MSAHQSGAYTGEVSAAMLAEAGVRTVTTSAGSPKKIYPRIKALGMKGLHVTLAAALALKAMDAGCDGVIISGTESGGLRTSGPESTNMILVPLVSDMVDVPVVAAGGIADRRGFRAALALELLPRTSRAQTMDVLSSQANIAGYKAVLLAAAAAPGASGPAADVPPIGAAAADTAPPAPLVPAGRPARYC